MKDDVNLKSKYDVFFDSLFRKYEEEEELERFLSSGDLSIYKIWKAKEDTLWHMFWLREGMGGMKEQENVKDDICFSLLNFKYYTIFINNIFKCVVRQKRFQQGLFQDMLNLKSLFHGTTTAFLPCIQKEGLLPSKAGQCWPEDKNKEFPKVCLTDSLYASEFFALVAAQKFGGNPIVLKVNVQGLKDKVTMRYEKLGFTVFDKCSEFFFTDPLQPDIIKVWYFLPYISAYQLLNDLIDIFNYPENPEMISIVETAPIVTIT